MPDHLSLRLCPDMSVAVQVDLSGINLIIDEADNVWSTFVDTNTFMPLQREGELYDLLGQHPAELSCPHH